MKNKHELIELPRVKDSRGNLSFIENNHHIPFAVERVFYLYDVPGGESRAGHALKSCQQFIIAVSGSFDVILNDGKNEFKYHLNRSYMGLYIPPLFWRDLKNFSSGSVSLVLASEKYDESSYFRDFKKFIAYMKEK